MISSSSACAVTVQNSAISVIAILNISRSRSRPSGGYRHRTDASESRDYHGPQIDGWEALLLEIN
jgi:hypothetical protein